MSIESRRGAVVAQLLRSGQSARLTAHGSSMAPAIRAGDVVALAPAQKDQLRVGDIALVRSGKILRLHRVASVAPLRTRGDNLAGADPATDEVLGRAVSVHKSLYSTARTLANRARRWLRATRTA